MVEILDQTKARYDLAPAVVVQQLLRRVPERDLAGLDALVLLDEDEAPAGETRLGYYRLARAVGGGRAQRKTSREIVLLIGPILRQPHRRSQSSILLAATLYQQIGQHSAEAHAPGISKKRLDAQRQAERYADRLLWPFIRQQVLRWFRFPVLLVVGALLLGIALLFIGGQPLATALLLAQITLLAPVLLLGAGGAFLPSTKRLVRPILLLWVGLVWVASALITLFASGNLQVAFSFGLALLSLTLGLGIAAAGGLAARLWWARPIGPIRPPLAVALFGLGLLASVAPFLHAMLPTRAAIAQASALWTLIGAASIALAIALGWWLYADLRQDALEVTAPENGEAATSGAK